MTVTNSDREALAHGKITTKPLRENPKVPTWALKMTMAVTGLIFGLFVIVHMLGNLKVFSGAESFDAYAHYLRAIGYPIAPHESVLWGLRIVLLVAVLLHIYGAFALNSRARQSRGKFRRQGMISGWNTFTARTMLVTGVVLLAFIIFHILDLTVGAVVAPSDFVHGEAYANLVSSFQRPAVAIWYVVAQLALLLHLSHGLWTASSDLGVTGHRWRKVILFLSGLIPLLVVVGNIAIPVAVMAGMVS